VSNVTTAWTAEGVAFTDGSPTTGGVQVDAAKLTAYVTGSFEIFQDSSLLAQLPGLIGESIDYAESAAFISGSGSGAPTGVITAVSGTAGSLVTVTTRGAFTSASIADTIALVNALAVRYEDTSTWVLNKAIYRTIEQQMVGTGAVKAIEMTNGRELFDMPVVRASSMLSATTSGNHIAVLGDFKQYIVYDRLGVNVEFIQNVVDGDGLPVGKRGLVAYKRVGGDTTDVNAFRLLKA
ncbi:MAG: phage major capsid protein, partial [Rhizobiaceae bacterium]|nr:phage major capsid protein [Rhizobiaceae bacterium]